MDINNNFRDSSPFTYLGSVFNKMLTKFRRTENGAREKSKSTQTLAVWRNLRHN